MTQEEQQRLLQLGVLEDSLALVKGPNNYIHIIIPTCTSIKFDSANNLRSKLVSMDAQIAALQARIAALENGNLGWNGLVQQQQTQSGN